MRRAKGIIFAFGPLGEAGKPVLLRSVRMRPAAR